MANEFKTSKEWYDTVSFGIEIYDPKGWDKANFNYSFYEEKITSEEFTKRLDMSLSDLIPITRRNGKESITQEIVRKIHMDNNYF